MSDVDQRRARALVRWFAAHRRDLPWRRHRTGYSALVAEAMLQQTQVARVIERFEQFMERFPTVAALAAADEQQVLAMWQGLGYYRRARHLHAAARTIVERHGGEVPDDVARLIELPGVGRYTAGAVASMAFGRAEPIVDGNVQRVLARWKMRKRPTAAWCWDRAERLVGVADDPGALNEALMELGATICTPRSPRCERCPVARDCEARQAGGQERIPTPKPAAPRRTVHHHAVVMQRNGQVLLELRPDRGLWSAMWQPPTVEADRLLQPAEIRAALGLALPDLRKRTAFVHQTTHRTVNFHVYRASTRRRRGEWRTIDALSDLPMSNAHRRVLEVALREKGDILLFRAQHPRPLQEADSAEK